jgi:putative spermidine/putrescine transport system ATP-binding protein
MDTLDLSLDHPLRSYRLSLDAALGRETLALVGPSGAGKSSVLRAISGLLRPERGRVALGEAVWLDTDAGIDLPPERRSVGLVFQEYALFPHLDVRRNVGFGGRERVDELLERFRISHLAGARPGDLSGGERQRVALARALARDPAVLLLDEPLSALDAKIRVSLRDEIRAIQKELGITTIYVTHDQEEALAISDRVAVLHDGRIDQVGTPVEMYGAPATPFVAEFIGTMNRLASTVVGDGVVDYAGQRLRVDAAKGLPNGERVLVLVRPETVSIAPAADGETPEGAFAGEVISQIFLGSVSRLRMAGSSGEGELTADLPTTHAQAHAVGDRVTGTFPSSTGRLLSLAEQPEPVAIDPDDR